MFIFETPTQLDTKQMHCSKIHTKYRETCDMAARAAVWRCSKHQKTLFTVSMVKQVTQRGCGVTILEEIQNLTGDGPGQPAQGGIAWSVGLSQMISKSLFQPKGFWFIRISAKTCNSFKRIVGSHVMSSLPTYNFLSPVWKHKRSSCRSTVYGSQVTICTDYKLYYKNGLK